MPREANATTAWVTNSQSRKSRLTFGSLTTKRKANVRKAMRRIARRRSVHSVRQDHRARRRYSPSSHRIPTHPAP